MPGVQVPRYPFWTRGDLDGFFGLMVDNLVQVLLIIGLCTSPFVCGLPPELVYGRVLPGVAVSLLIGNLFYGWQARRVARRDGNRDCTALPYGINTPSVFAFALFIMAPVYHRYEPQVGAAAAGQLAWQAGLLACVVSGLIEFCGAFVAERLRRATPRAALLGVLAGVGIAFIASDFAFRIYNKPLIALLPLAFVLLAYFGRYRFPLRLPGGFLAVLLGTAIAWATFGSGTPDWLGGPSGLSAERLAAATGAFGWRPPVFCGPELLAMLQRPEILIPFLTVSIPMGLLNVLGSLQNIESAEAAGDRFRTAPALAMNGLGTLAAAAFGSCFPTTIYIGHPAWKSLGARSGYSLLNGAFFTVLFLLGAGPFLAELVPIEAGAAIVLYIGIIITAQAFAATPRAHAPAVAIALFPALAALLVLHLPLILRDAAAPTGFGALVSHVAPTAFVRTLPGMVALTGANSSWLVTTLILAAAGAALIDRRLRLAAIWFGVAAGLTAVGLLHAYRIDPAGELRELFIWQSVAPGEVGSRAFPIAIGYALGAALFALAGLRSPADAALPATDDVGPASDAQPPASVT